MHSNLSPYLIDVMAHDAERNANARARAARTARGPQRRLGLPRFLRRRPRGGRRPGRRVAPT